MSFIRELSVISILIPRPSAYFFAALSSLLIFSEILSLKILSVAFSPNTKATLKKRSLGNK